MNKIITKPLPLKKGQKLIHAINDAGFDYIPSNIILDKKLPGLGATYTEIHAHRHSIIIEPNVPVIVGKLKKHKDLNLLGVYKGKRISSIKKYLLDTSIPYKKILVTPESFFKVREASREIDLDIYNDYFCMFDECERLTQDVGFRKKSPIRSTIFSSSKTRLSFRPPLWISSILKQSARVSTNLLLNLNLDMYIKRISS